MIKFIQDGSIFASKCDMLVNPVNSIGVCGKGLAKEFKERFPQNYRQYVKDCNAGLYKPGDVILFRSSFIDEADGVEQMVFVANFATKAHWNKPSKLEWIEKGLKQLADIVYTNGWSMAIPAVGCGNGGLNWANDVRPLVWRYFYLEVNDIEKRQDVLIEVYEPT